MKKWVYRSSFLVFVISLADVQILRSCWVTVFTLIWTYLVSFELVFDRSYDTKDDYYTATDKLQSVEGLVEEEYVVEIGVKHLSIHEHANDGGIDTLKHARSWHRRQEVAETRGQHFEPYH